MELTLITIVAVHLLAVNLAGAGPLVAVWADWRGCRLHQPELQEAGLRLAFWSIWTAFLGVGLGVAAWFELAYWPPHSQQSFWWLLNDSITLDRWRFIIVELAFYLVCMIGCVWLWKRPARRWLCRLLAIAAATNLLYHFPPLFTVLAIKFEQHNWHALDHSSYLHLLFTPEAVARILHVWLASFATAGLAISWSGARRSTLPTAALVVETKCSAAIMGGRWALWATMLQIPVGVWVLFSLPDVQGQRIMTGSPIFLVAVIAALALMHQLAMLALGDASRRRLSQATLLMIIVVIAMTAALVCSRPV